MIRSSVMFSTMLSLGILLGSVPQADASAQMRRSPDGGASGPSPKGIPRVSRFPFAGVWDGSFTLVSGLAADGRQVPIVMVVTVGDSAAAEAKAQYVAATILPNGARAPHLETTVRNGAMRWKQENSGGGFWVYTGKLVGADSIAGTVVLENWPQLPAGEKAPTGRFSLVRRAPGL